MNSNIMAIHADFNSAEFWPNGESRHNGGAPAPGSPASRMNAHGHIQAAAATIQAAASPEKFTIETQMQEGTMPDIKPNLAAVLGHDAAGLPVTVGDTKSNFSRFREIVNFTEFGKDARAVLEDSAAGQALTLQEIQGLSYEAYMSLTPAQIATIYKDPALAAALEKQMAKGQIAPVRMYR